MFTDTHCHIFSEYYNNIDDIINISKSAKVNRLINNGYDNNSNIEVIRLCNIYSNMYGALGIHPENVLKYNNSDISFIENNINNPKIIAIGEIGLDYHYSKEQKEKQIILFEKQLSLAEKYNIPVIVHSRDATLDTINSLKKYKIRGTIHSFSGSYETAMEYIKMGFYLGINGVVTFKNSNFKDILLKIPLDSIILETDSPYLTPEPFRGKQNNPSHIDDIANFVCKLKNINKEELSEITNNNIKKLYNI